MLSQTDFLKVTKLIIENIEGGYYNNVWHKSESMGRSGETMFGIDRLHGKPQPTSAEYNDWMRFWQIIDKAKSQQVWKHYYRGGSLEKQLTELAAKIQYTRYLQWSRLFLTQDAQKIVNNNKKLALHFIYATWNGAGYFQNWAILFNNRIKKTKNADKLFAMCMQDRRTDGIALHKIGADKLEKIVSNNKMFFASKINIKKAVLVTLGAAALIGTGIYFLRKKY